MRSLLAWLSIVVVVLMSVARPLAIERRRFPQFPLTTPDGRVVASTALVKPGRWVVVYVPSAVAAAASCCDSSSRMTSRCFLSDSPSSLAVRRRTG